MKRVLCIMGNMGLGGAETHIMKVYRAIDKASFQFDFLLNTENKCFYEDEIKDLGGRIFRVSPKSNGVLKYIKALINIVKKNNYDCVLKCGENAASWIDMMAAKIGGAHKRIMRSTNSNGVSSLRGKILHYLSRPLLRLFTTSMVAPSALAAEWLFGKKYIDRVEIVHNGVDLPIYQFDVNKREALRERLNIKRDMIVLGHVGRFTKQKNHHFLIEVFDSILKKTSKEFVLMLIGDGENRAEIIELVMNKNIESKVLFIEPTASVSDYYSAMDCFVFPSIYEGMPNTVIEAQANGLPCIVSNTITNEANITGNVQYVPIIPEAIDEWCSRIINCPKRYDSSSKLKTNGYDIDSVVETYKAILK